MRLPALDDAPAIFAFAMTFNAYEHYGSLANAAQIARLAPRSNINEVRAELFFKARAARHLGNDDYVASYAELLPYLQQWM